MFLFTVLKDGISYKEIKAAAQRLKRQPLLKMSINILFYFPHSLIRGCRCIRVPFHPKGSEQKNGCLGQDSPAFRSSADSAKRKRRFFRDARRSETNMPMSVTARESELILMKRKLQNTHIQIWISAGFFHACRTALLSAHSLL